MYQAHTLHKATLVWRRRLMVCAVWGSASLLYTGCASIPHPSKLAVLSNETQYSERAKTNPLLNSPLLSASTDPAKDARDSVSHLSYAQWQQSWHTDAPVYLTDLMYAPELNALLKTALSHNPSIQQSQLAHRIAQKHVILSEAAFLPNVMGKLDTSKAKSSQSRFGLGITATWEPDVWQAISLTYAQQHARSLATEMQLNATRNALAANMMQQYLQLAYHTQRIRIQQSRVRSLQLIEKTVTGRFRLGLTQLTQLSNARKNVLQARAQLPDYMLSKGNSERQLAALVGVLSSSNSPTLLTQPVRLPEVAFPLAQLTVPHLGQRPDLQQAYFNIRAAELSRDISYRDMLPRLSVSATLSQTARHPEKLLSTSPVWNLLGQLTAPLFNRGQLKQQAKISDLKAAQAYWSFQETLINAYTSVQTKLHQDIALTKQVNTLQHALRHAQLQNRNIQQQYRSGSINLDDWLNAQQQQYDIEMQILQLRYVTLVNRVTLGLELGLGVMQLQS